MNRRNTIGNKIKIQEYKSHTLTSKPKITYDTTKCDDVDAF